MKKEKEKKRCPTPKGEAKTTHNKRKETKKKIYYKNLTTNNCNNTKTATAPKASVMNQKQTRNIRSKQGDSK